MLLTGGGQKQNRKRRPHGAAGGICILSGLETVLAGEAAGGCLALPDGGAAGAGMAGMARVGGVLASCAAAETIDGLSFQRRDGARVSLDAQERMKGSQGAVLLCGQWNIRTKLWQSLDRAWRKIR